MRGELIHPLSLKDSCSREPGADMKMTGLEAHSMMESLLESN